MIQFHMKDVVVNANKDHCMIAGVNGMSTSTHAFPSYNLYYNTDTLHAHIIEALGKLPKPALQIEFNKDLINPGSARAVGTLNPGMRESLVRALLEVQRAYVNSALSSSPSSSPSPSS